MSVINAVLWSMPLVAVSLGLVLPWRAGAPLLLGLVAILELAMSPDLCEESKSRPGPSKLGRSLGVFEPRFDFYCQSNRVGGNLPP